ncbi:MAG: GNAT family N-acetyltransferase [Butyrivibrio sp.]|uniref:GNAT family N-acetyltransferase n=1 Tax=Butyrivibrio sp. TaxID=28121 RepID=UPI001B2DCBB2|nr:GNAT family N-acetyltransferase [Butyrivibrio sp.]MBO6239890.1 GNAT family N-acetyltransferase [Butyrivibrio sp.]
MGTVLETKRLILRGWQDSDAASLFKYASDERIGPAAGWLPHESVGYSRAVIRTIFNKKEVYAICLKGGNNEPIGSIGLTLDGSKERPIKSGEAELGYWVGVPFWGRGIASEAAMEMLRRGFVDLKLDRIFCCYFDGNVKSKRVQEKCGFTHYKINEKTYIAMLKETRKEYVNVISASDWERHGY